MTLPHALSVWKVILAHSPMFGFCLGANILALAILYRGCPMVYGQCSVLLLSWLVISGLCFDEQLVVYGRAEIT